MIASTVGVARLRRGVEFDVELEEKLRQARAVEFARLNRRDIVRRRRERVGVALLVILCAATFLIWRMGNDRPASPSLDAIACPGAFAER